MDERDREVTDARVDELCRAASAMYYSVLRCHARRTGSTVVLPELLCPREGLGPLLIEFDDEVLDEAEDFLLRLGVIAEHPTGPDCR